MKKLLVLSGLIILFASCATLMLFHAEAKNSILIEQAGREAEKTDTGETGTKETVPVSESGYCYRQLSVSEQALYVKILQALLHSESDVQVNADIQERTFDKVFQCVLNDHPEIFYVDGFTIISYKESGVTTGQSFSGRYVYTREEIGQRRERIEAVVQGILREIEKGTTEYEKVRYVYEYLVRNTEYVMDSPDSQNICSVFLNGRSVCQGYAKAAQYLLKRLGVEALLVSGTVDEGEDHVWNIVQIDGAYYHMDVTWGDASYVAVENEEMQGGRLPQINYDYLCVPDEQLKKTHTICNQVPVPVCESMEANYYVAEGAYFTEPDSEKTEQLFAEAYERQEEYITLKCAEWSVFEKMRKELIEEQKVFAYLQSLDKIVAYTVNEQQLTLSFWLRG